MRQMVHSFNELAYRMHQFLQCRYHHQAPPSLSWESGSSSDEERGSCLLSTADLNGGQGDINFDDVAVIDRDWDIYQLKPICMGRPAAATAATLLPRPQSIDGKRSSYHNFQVHIGGDFNCNFSRTTDPTDKQFYPSCNFNTYVFC